MLGSGDRTVSSKTEELHEYTCDVCRGKFYVKEYFDVFGLTCPFCAGKGKTPPRDSWSLRYTNGPKK